MKILTKALPLLAVGWCLTWWGHLVGWRSAQETEIRSIGRDIALLEAFRKEVPQDCPCAGLQELIELKSQELVLLNESATNNFATVLLYPLFAPFEHGQLLLTRWKNSTTSIIDDSNERPADIQRPEAAKLGKRE